MDVYLLTDGAIMQQIGSKVKDLRIAKGMKQVDLAKASGVSVFTISAVENGKATSMLTMIQLLRALEKLDYLDSFFQEAIVSPMAYAKLMEGNKRRERVNSPKVNVNTEIESDESW
mgnify:FL=1